MGERTKQQCVSDGLDLFAARKVHEAIEAYEEALELDDRYAEAYLGLAKAHESMGALDDAIAILRRGAERIPDESFIHTSLSQCLQKKGLIPEAETEMAIAAQLNQSGH